MAVKSNAYWLGFHPKYELNLFAKLEYRIKHLRIKLVSIQWVEENKIFFAWLTCAKYHKETWNKKYAILSQSHMSFMMRIKDVMLCFSDIFKKCL